MAGFGGEASFKSRNALLGPQVCVFQLRISTKGGRKDRPPGKCKKRDQRRPRHRLMGELGKRGARERVSVYVGRGRGVLLSWWSRNG